MRRRVVITGMGCVTPLGATRESLWEGLVGGRSGIGRLTLFDPARYPVRIAAEVRGWSLAEVGLDPRRWEKSPRQTAFAIGAGVSAARSAGLAEARFDPTRFGVYLGCGEAFEDFPRFIRSVREACDAEEKGSGVFFRDDGKRRVLEKSSSVTKKDSRPRSAFILDRFLPAALRIFDPASEPEYEPHSPAAHLAGLLGAEGPNANCIAACVSSAQAIGRAAALIRRGEADLMLAGGAHSTIHPFGVTGFHRLSALSTRNEHPEAASRPFDRDRDGFVIGEGAAAFLLEDLEHARRRGAEILGELTGFGSAQDAYRVTDTHPEGRGTRAALAAALRDAGLNTDEIDYINAHGTGTPLNDKIETLVLKRVFGARAYRIPVSSSKSMLGHATTACGAIEAAVSLLAIRHQTAPPTINYETPDPDCDLDYVPNIAREIRCRHVLSESIGFGGQNAALVISRFDEASRSSVAARKAA